MTNTSHVAGATSKIVKLRAVVISTGLPYTAGAFNTATISATYTRDGSTATTITLVTATAGTWTSSGLVHAGKGVYELGAPNAALVAGVDGVDFAVDGIADVLWTTARVEIVSSNPRAAASTTTEIADAFLDRDMSAGTDSGSPTFRTPRQALRALRNKVSVASGTATVTKENDSTASWTAAITGTPSVTAVDPAS